MTNTQLTALARPVFRAFGEGYCHGTYLRLENIAGKWDFNAVAFEEVTFVDGSRCTGTIYVPSDKPELDVPPNCGIKVVRLSDANLLKKARELR